METSTKTKRIQIEKVQINKDSNLGKLLTELKEKKCTGITKSDFYNYSDGYSDGTYSDSYGDSYSDFYSD